LTKILAIKPFLEVKDGKFAALETVRSKKKALSRLLKVVKERAGEAHIARAAVIHADAPEEGRALQGEVQALLKTDEVYLVETSATLGARVGPGMLGVAFYTPVPVKDIVEEKAKKPLRAREMLVDLMVIVLKMKPGVLIQISSRGEAERFATRILNDELPGAKLSSSSKLSIQQAPDSVTVSEAQKGLSETTQTEMGKAGLDPSAYNMRTLTVTESGNTYLCMLAIRR